MNKRALLKVLLASALALAGSSFQAIAADAVKKVLVVSVTAGFRHTEGIEASEKVLPKIARESGVFTIDWCEQPGDAPQRPQRPKDPTPADEEKFQAAQAKYELAAAEFQKKMRQTLQKLSPENLKQYDAVIFNNTTGDLPLPNREAFLEWIKSGKGFVGIHAATDTYHNYKPYVDMIGGRFLTHGPQATVECLNQDPNHPASKNWGPSITLHEEIYLLRDFDRKTVHGLIGLDKHPNTGEAGDYPIAWCKKYGDGRVFYTSLGHRADIWDEDTSPNYKRMNSKEVSRAFQQHLLGGIKWALGLVPGDATPQVK
jgi:uncharacterized protein